LFLDELHRASETLIGHLLPILAGDAFSPLGSSRLVTPSARIIIATNCDPEQLVSDGRWPLDFLARLGYARFCLPPLRERREEVLPTITELLDASSESRSPAPRRKLSRELQHYLLDARWRFNFWSLTGVARFLNLRPSSELTVDDLPVAFVEEERRIRQTPLPTLATRRHRTNEEEAAARGISVRHYLRLKAKERKRMS
jgi:arginine utilization regulatory protein